MAKDLIIVEGLIRTPPMSTEVRKEVGYQLRRLQEGETLSLPVSRPMPSIGKRCHELRVHDKDIFWRIIYRIDVEEIIVFALFKKKTNRTPKRIVKVCRDRIKAFDR